MKSEQNSESRNYQIDGLRGLAISMIVLYHLICRFSELYLDKTIGFLNCWGVFGVSVFLLISSYFFINAEPGSIKSIAKKIFRLWPSYVVSITLTQIVMRILPLPGRVCGWSEYAWNIPFLNGFIGIPYVDGAHWYLTILIALIVVTGIIRMLRVQDRLITNIVWMVLALAVRKVFGSDWARLLGGSYVGAACIGIAIRHIDWTAVSDRKNLGWYGIIAVGYVLSGVMLGIKYAVALPIAILLLAASVTRKLPVLERRGFQAVGRISYPLYLVHQNIGLTIEYALMGVFHQYSYWFVLPAAAVAVACSVIVYRFVELPSQKARNARR